jgi:hypothetical protein
VRLALATINFHDVLCRNARQSFEDAARRWSAEFIELTEENMPANVHFLMGKTVLFDVAPWADRVFYVDGGDAIIRGDTPSPFDVCPPDKLGVVEDGNRAFPNWSRLVSQQKSEWRRINRLLGQRVPFTDFFFNAGVLVLTRDAHERLLKRTLELSRLLGHTSWWDQSVLNYAVVELGSAVLRMDRAWNVLQQGNAGTPMWMEGYVYHYAGIGQRYSVIPMVNWRTPGPRSGIPCSAKRSRMSRVFQFLRSAPVLGPIVQYLYWWFSLPVKVNHLFDQVTEINHMLKGLYLRQAERTPGEKPRPLDPRP